MFAPKATEHTQVLRDKKWARPRRKLLRGAKVHGAQRAENLSGLSCRIRILALLRGGLM